MEANSIPSTSDLVAAARAEGIADPVILYLDAKSSQAHSVFQALHGIEMTPSQVGFGVFGAVEKVSSSEAIRLVRQHCGSAGVFVGNVLGQRQPAEYRAVYLWRPNSQVVTVTESRRTDHIVLGYERVMLSLRRSEPKATTGDSQLYMLDVDQEETVPICAPLQLACDAGFLIVLAAKRRGWVLRKGEWRHIEAFDSDLAAELLKLKDQPAVIAEAVRALRKLGQDKDRWLMSVLLGRRPLRHLARLVDRELTGQ